MIRHWLTIAWRGLKANPVFAVISILSLAVGCGGALLVGAYIHQELTFDNWVPGSARMVRLDTTMTYPGRDPQAMSMAPSGLGPLLMEQLPGVEAVTRIRQSQVSVKQDDGAISLFPGFVDPSFFEVIPLELSEGDPATALADPSNVVLSAETRDRLFGDGPAVGQALEFEGFDTGAVVTGVLKRKPQNRRFNLQMIASLEAPFGAQPQSQSPPVDETFNFANVVTYIRADSAARARGWRKSLPALAQDIVARNTELPDGVSMTFEVTPFRSMYLGPQKGGFSNAGGDAQRLVLFGLVAAALLVVSAFNYVSLSLARVVRRTREVGLRKAMGATRGDLIRQHLAESVLLTATALVLGFGLAALVLPWFARQLQLTLPLGALMKPSYLGIALAAGAVLAVLVAAYPAMFLARVRPASILQGRSGPTRTLATAIFGLVAIQFVAATALGASVAVFYAQARYLANGDLGFETKDRFMLFAGGIRITTSVSPEIAEQNLAARSRLEAQLADEPAVISLSGSSLPALLGVGTGLFDALKLPVFVPERPTDEAGRAMPVMVDFDFFETMGVRLAAGRLFSEDLGTDRVFLDNPAAKPDVTPSVVTRAFLPLLGVRAPEEAIGKRVSYRPPGAPDTVEATNLEIVGVVDDLYFQSLRAKAVPLMFTPNPGGANILVARIDGARRQEAVDALVAAIKATSPGEPAQAVDMQQMAANQYSEDRRWRRLITVVAGLALAVASAGLFGLTAFSADRARREVGVRKSLGADRDDILRLMLVRFVRPVAIGVVGGWLIAYYATARWLAGFAYHTPLTPIPFLIAGVGALVVAVATVLAHALGSARASPAAVLRHD